MNIQDNLIPRLQDQIGALNQRATEALLRGDPAACEAFLVRQMMAIDDLIALINGEQSA